MLQMHEVRICMKLQMHNVITENNITGQTNAEKTCLDRSRWFLRIPAHILPCLIHCRI